MTFNQRTGALNPHERAALAKFLACYPRPIGVIAWIHGAKDNGPANELLGQCELEARGWLRVRRRRVKMRTIEITSRAVRELPLISDARARAAFIAETAASMQPAPKTQGMMPIEVLINCILLAADEEAPADVRKFSQLISEGLLQLAVSAGFPTADRDALLQAIADRDYDAGNDLGEAAVEFITPDRFRALLRSCGAEYLIDGVETSH